MRELGWAMLAGMQACRWISGGWDMQLAGLLVVTLPLVAALTDAEVERHLFQRLQLINIDTILSNTRIVSKYLRCMLRAGVCPPEARDFRRTLPSILQRLCENCTERQRTSLQKMFDFVKTSYPDEWGRLLTIYDLKEEHRENLEKFINGT